MESTSAVSTSFWVISSLWVPLLGLFMDTACAAYNQFFRLAPFNDKFSFVYLNRHLEYLNQRCQGKFPAMPDLLADSPAPFLPGKFVSFKTSIRRCGITPRLTSELNFLTAWDFHYKRHPEMLQALLLYGFSLKALGYPGTWNEEVDRMERTSSTTNALVAALTFQ